MADVAQNVPDKRPSVAIVGGGWAGLSCALRLARSGLRPIIYESAPEPGGRARRAPLVDHQAQAVWRDNGQHLMLAGCRSLNTLCNEVGVTLSQTPFNYTDGNRQLSLAGRDGRAGLLVALLNARGFRWGERLRLLQALLALQWRGWQVMPAQTVQQWLIARHQPSTLIRDFWAPLALAILNTPIEQAAMSRLAAVLRDTLGGGCKALAILQPDADLSTSVVTPLVEAITMAGGELRCGRRVEAVTSQPSGGFRLMLADGTSTEADQVVLALPPWALTRLALPFDTRDLATRFGTQPIATVYLGFEVSTRLPAPLVQIDGPTAEDARAWVMDRAHCGEPGVMAVSLSADGPWQQLDHDMLVTRCLQRLLPLLGSKPHDHRCLWHKVVTVRRATYAATPTARLDPSAQNPLPGCFLAGDWTHPDYPATLEAAVASGFAVADQIMLPAA